MRAPCKKCGMALYDMAPQYWTPMHWCPSPSEQDRVWAHYSAFFSRQSGHTARISQNGNIHSDGWTRKMGTARCRSVRTVPPAFTAQRFVTSGEDRRLMGLRLLTAAEGAAPATAGSTTWYPRRTGSIPRRAAAPGRRAGPPQSSCRGGGGAPSGGTAPSARKSPRCRRSPARS